MRGKARLQVLQPITPTRKCWRKLTVMMDLLSDPQVLGIIWAKDTQSQGK